MRDMVISFRGCESVKEVCARSSYHLDRFIHRTYLFVQMAAPPIDRLSSLLERFRVRAHLFHNGPLCGTTSFAAEPGRGFLHVLRRGEMVVTHACAAARRASWS